MALCHVACCTIFSKTSIFFAKKTLLCVEVCIQNLDFVFGMKHAILKPVLFQYLDFFQYRTLRDTRCEGVILNCQLVRIGLGQCRLGSKPLDWAMCFSAKLPQYATAKRLRNHLRKQGQLNALGSNPLFMLGSIFSPLVDNFPQKYKHGTKLSSSRQAKQPEQSSDRHDMCLHATQVSPLTKMMMMMMM